MKSSNSVCELATTETPAITYVLFCSSVIHNLISWPFYTKLAYKETSGTRKPPRRYCSAASMTRQSGLLRLLSRWLRGVRWVSARVGQHGQTPPRVSVSCRAASSWWLSSCWTPLAAPSCLLVARSITNPVASRSTMCYHVLISSTLFASWTSGTYIVEEQSSED